MRKISLLFVLSLISFCGKTQITLEKKYASGEDVRVCFLEGEGIKYYSSKAVIDQNKKTGYVSISLYNLDHSIFKSFNSPFITVGSKSTISMGNYSASHISTKLFNTSSDIEYQLSYTVSDTLGDYIPCTGCSKLKITMNSGFVRVFNENGVPIFQCDTCNPDYLGSNYVLSAYSSSSNVSNINGQYKYKIVSSKISDGATWSGRGTSSYWSKQGTTNLIYSLPGSFSAPTAINDEHLNDKTKASLSAPMPNPSSETTRVEFQLPDDVSFGEITVYNSMGLRLKSYRVDDTFGDLLLNNTDLPTGTYNYQLVAGGKRIGSQKMLVIK
jgi:hypothetical protein